jgi:hypothetical protein
MRMRVLAPMKDLIQKLNTNKFVKNNAKGLTVPTALDILQISLTMRS